MEMVAEVKMRMIKKSRLSLEACERDLEEKARQVAELKMERQRKKQQVGELDGIMRLKQAETDMRLRLRSSSSSIRSSFSRPPALLGQLSSLKMLPQQPAESDSSQEIWPTASPLMSKRPKKAEGENEVVDQSVVRHVSRSNKMSLQDVARERVDVISEQM
ncbi:hypothetical protein V2J09_005965 [Rumex salicifolius]